MRSVEIFSQFHPHVQKRQQTSETDAKHRLWYEFTIATSQKQTALFLGKVPRA
jgi:hypothetical protein